jgi:hypothetical protein
MPASESHPNFVELAGDQNIRYYRDDNRRLLTTRLTVYNTGPWPHSQLSFSFKTDLDHRPHLVSVVTMTRKQNNRQRGLCRIQFGV